MARRRGSAWHARWPGTAAWLLVLALAPWWLGLPLLSALVAIVLLPSRWGLSEYGGLIRHGLRWGLPGLMLAVLRTLGGNAYALSMALLGLLSGYTLLAGLEAWLDRNVPRAPAPADSADWPELALAPIGPPAEIIELQLPVWQPADTDLHDPQGGMVSCRDRVCRFTDGSRIEAPVALGGFEQIGFSPQGHWFAARTRDHHGLILWDRRRDRPYPLRGWQLCGWHREQPWLSRHDDDMPQRLSDVLGSDDED
ncbi:MAG TPA: hypothetical protein VN043_15750 [Rhodanobacter sp.]|nr:hypothetical protein [Rhodanobacter sp.]